MRQLTDTEMIAFRELLQVETNALAKSQATLPLITDEQLKIQAQSGATACKARIKGIQEFLNENNVIQTTGGVQ